MKAMSQKQIWYIQSGQRSPYAGVNKERTEFKRLWGFGRCREPFSGVMDAEEQQGMIIDCSVRNCLCG